MFDKQANLWLQHDKDLTYAFGKNPRRISGVPAERRAREIVDCRGRFPVHNIPLIDRFCRLGERDPLSSATVLHIIHQFRNCTRRSKFMKRIISTLMLGVLLVSVSAEAEMVVRRDPVQPQFFGWVIQRAHTNTAWPEVAFGTWRLWDSYLKWSDLEPSDGNFNFDVFDRQVALGETNRKEIIYTFGQTPRWASETPDDKHAWGMGAGSMPVRMDLWKRYIEAVVIRYKGRIAKYEVWNEPKYKDDKGKCAGAIFFCGTASNLVQLTAVASEILRRVDPAAKLASPGFSDGLKGVARLDDYLSAGGAKYVNAISFHFYSLQPEAAFETVRALRVVMRKHGLQDAPIWDTEHGYLIQNQDKKMEPAYSMGPFSKVFSPEEGAEAMAKAHLVEASAGLEHIIWYSWDNIRTGAIGVIDGKPTAFAKGYSVVQRWLVGSAIRCNDTEEGGFWKCNVQRGGRTADIVWESGTSSNKRYLIAGTGRRWVGTLLLNPVVADAGQSINLNGLLTIISSDSEPW